MICSTCNFDNPVSMKFCGGCGARIEVRSLQEERRHLTVMFCDLLESTVMAQRLDPEDMLHVVRAFQSAARQAVEQYDGHVAQYLGDGLLIYFGYPTAHEDDATRAMHAGLEILSALSELSERMQRERGVSIDGRIGVHSGLAVTERFATGSVPNTAARIQSQAQAGELLISADVHALLDSSIDCELAGAYPLRGLSGRTVLFRVKGLAPVPTHEFLERSAFVGRGAELHGLLDAYGRANQGSGRTLYLRAEAGIGKSRLVRELAASLGGLAETVTCRCAAYQQHTPYYPILDALSRAPELGQEQDDTLLADFLAQKALTAPTDRRQRRDTISAVARSLLRYAGNRNRLLIFEDLHWADPSSLEVIQEVAALAKASSTLVLATFRPSFAPTWPTPAEDVINLKPLTADEAMAFLQENHNQLAPSARQSIVQRSDGVPLFLEELCVCLRDDTDKVPLTLRDALTARLDALREHREVVQIAALIGRRFTLQMIADAGVVTLPVIRQSIAAAEQQGLVVKLATHGEGVFAFRHALIQETAYDTILRQRRKQLHGEVAARMRASHSEDHALMALHAERAEQFTDAVHAYRNASKASHQRGAYVEALHFQDRALELLGMVAASPENRRERFSLLLTRAHLATVLFGYTDEEVVRSFEQARALLDAGDIEADPFRFYRGYWGLHASRSDIDRATVAANVLSELAERSKNRLDQQFAVTAHAGNAFYNGKLEEASRLFNSVLGSDAEAVAREMGMGLVVAHLSLAWCSSLRGDVDRATSILDNVRRAAINDDAQFLLAHCLCFSCAIFEDIGKPMVELKETADTAEAVCSKQGFGEWLGYARMHAAYALAREGDAQGLRDMERLVAELYNGRGENSWAHSLMTLAEVQLLHGDAKSALHTIEQALRICRDRVGRYAEADCHRVHAEILLNMKQGTKARAALARAAATARADGAYYPLMRTLTRWLQIEPQNGLEAQLDDVLNKHIHGVTRHVQDARALLSAEAI
ncbi:MAG: AAA family ATPase [Pseudomonadales bacterium]|nr:AAA family ATPase [Pseudomonadales bacterium]MCP5182467.1 AAA family ATPase [Pseudomonadales bacterium]